MKSSYKTYIITFQAVFDEKCVIVVHGVDALTSDGAERQAAQVLANPKAFKVVAIDCEEQQ